MGMNELIRHFARELSLPSTGLEVLKRELPLMYGKEQGVLASSLRAAGLPVQALSLETPPSYPFFSERAGEYALCSPAGDKVRVFSSVGEEETVDRDAVQWKSIVTVPPVGQTFRVNEVHSEHADSHEIAVFYAATTASADLAKQQVIPDLEKLLNRANRERKKVVFIDAVGLIPEEAVHKYGLHDEAFKRILDLLQQELDGLSQGRPVSETRSPLWREIYNFLAEHRIGAILERFPPELDQSIKDFDKQELAKQAIGHLIAGQVEEAAELMMRYLSEFHRLNCTLRKKYLFAQVKDILDGSESRLILVILREIGHYGIFESAFHEYPKTTKIIGHEKFTDLIGVTSYGNFNVVVPDEILRANAVQYCLRTLIAPRIAAGESFNEIVARFAKTGIDRLDRETVQEIFSELHHPSRVFLRSTPHDQNLQDQLLYILVDRGIVLRELIADPAGSLSTVTGGEGSGKAED